MRFNVVSMRRQPAGCAGQAFCTTALHRSFCGLACVTRPDYGFTIGKKALSTLTLLLGGRGISINTSSPLPQSISGIQLLYFAIAAIATVKRDGRGSTRHHDCADPMRDRRYATAVRCQSGIWLGIRRTV